MAIYDVNGNTIAFDGGENPINGKTIILIGDSNTQYQLTGIENHFRDVYNANVRSYATAGATWETTAGTETTSNTSAVGQVNNIIAGYGDNDSKIFPEDVIIVIMMGTNCTNAGETTDTANDVSTACGAMRWVFQKLCYYARPCPIGVIIPISTTLREEITAIATEFGLPMIDMEKEVRIISNGKTPDGNNYYTDGGNHFGANGSKHYLRVMGKWVAYGL